MPGRTSSTPLGLHRAPAFTALAAGTLGLALGALTGIFSVVEAVLLRPLPYADPDRIVFIVASAPGSEMEGEFGVSAEFYLQYQEASLLEDSRLPGLWRHAHAAGGRPR